VMVPPAKGEEGPGVRRVRRVHAEHGGGRRRLPLAG
jgi:hypothetical protein